MSGKARCLAQAVYELYTDTVERKAVLRKIMTYINPNLHEDYLYVLDFKGKISISEWNDTHKFKDVLKLINTLDI